MAGNTLIICYDFPPNEGIGGRRWAKLARVLAERGTRIQVIKAEPRKGNLESAWTPDVQHPNIQVHSLKRSYPEALSHPSPGIMGKIRYRLTRFLFRRRFKGSIYDLGINWDKLLIPAAIALIDRHQIVNLIVTGAPFSLFEHAARIKALRPGIFLHLDYRDPWLTAVNYGIPGLRYADFLEEKRKQLAGIRAADLITAPNEFMLEEIRSSSDYLSNTAVWDSLIHFYDEADIHRYLNAETGSEYEGLNLVYGGSLYLGLEPHIARLCRLLDELRTLDPKCYGNLHIRIFSKDLQYRSWFSSHPGVFDLRPPIGKELFAEVRRSQGVLILLAGHNKHYLTTKFAELLPFRKPMVFLGEAGHASGYIEQQGLGFCIREDAAELLRELKSLSGYPRNEFDVEAFSLQKVCTQLEGHLR